MRPIVHIGYHKTATTWFQQRVYPHASSHRWVPRERVRKALLDPCGLSFDPIEARRILDDPNDPRPPLICEENLSGYIHNGGLHGMLAPEIARRIKLVYPSAMIVMLIRAQPQMVAATYVQYIRGGGTHGPRRYLFPGRYLLGAYRHAYKAPRFAFEHFRYDRLIAHYDALFGQENVVVRPYEALKAGHVDFLDDLCRTTGLRVDRSMIQFRADNKSFGLATLWIGRLLGLFTARSVMDKTCLLGIPGFYELRRVILKGIATLDPTPSGLAVLPRSVLDHVRSFYAEGNGRLAVMRDLDLIGLGYPVRPSAPVYDDDDWARGPVAEVIPIAARAR